MFAGLNGWHLIILLAVILLLFGAAKLPALAKSMGQSARVFKGEMSAMKEEDAARTEQREADKGDKSDGSTAPGSSSTPDTDRPS
ncbi:Sec-independent protein translocase subunit TatA [Microbacterium pseudoresistens]|uniref:Sec-independent protein translocase protein TatA n=1 Tax=Microbacterium pseudoresistens TaxID=640634 RepID=A0A7Y9EX71_9MICO|nr:twin-arginine translocase TatA/TatE family subunit [Microbacterium pseudoresistens]NYD55421.1 sec-independent protein translocase protein TatA [Microbacterium pseudoresistens]